MKFKKITVAFDAKNILLAEEMICHIFFSFHLTGVICNIPLEEPDEGFGIHTLDLPVQNSIVGYLPDLDASDMILDKIQDQTQALAVYDIQTRIEVELVDEQDWADAWKDYFHVTHITERIVIKPAWRDHDPLPGELVIHLDPGMAFGTGTHPTTAMCIRMIEQFLVPGTEFLDVGTGSGILMIAAEKLGAARMTGIDTDPVAIQVSRENLDKNQVNSQAYELFCAPLDQTPKKSYGMIAANIIAQVIVNILPDIHQRLAPGGKAILSGIVQEQRSQILSALEKSSLKLIHEINDNEWITLAVGPNPSPEQISS